MKVLVPVSTMVKIAFWVCVVAAVAGFCLGRQLSEAPAGRASLSATDPGCRTSVTSAPNTAAPWSCENG